MGTIGLGPYDYDVITTCPFCGRYNTLDGRGECCPHFCVAFVDGGWAVDLCPPVAENGNGFKFQRIGLELLLAAATEAIAYLKPGTRRHPRITVWYRPAPAFVTELQEAFRLPVLPIEGTCCGACGSTEAVKDENSYFVSYFCAVCGELMRLELAG